MFIPEDEQIVEAKKEQLPLHLKYRPKTLAEVLGQDHVVKSIESLFPYNVPHAFLFTGITGTGKTTLARIIASMLEISKYDVVEIDAAKNTGVDDMREVIEVLRYSGVGPNGRKMVILDEAHMLSKQAWNSILKEIEEPSEFVYWVLCTTELGKVLDTVTSRCTTYQLNPFGLNSLMEFVEHYAGEEGIKLPKGAVEAISKYAEGSPRRSLVGLSQVRCCTTLQEVHDVLKTVKESDVIDLCRLLVSKNDFDKMGKAIKILNDLKDMESESIRIPVVRYFASCILQAKQVKGWESNVLDLNNKMKPFLNPTNKSTGVSEILSICLDILADRADL